MIVLEAAKHVTVTYNLGNLADWLSAIGTIAAVITSLYLASKRSRPRLFFMMNSDGFAFVYNKSFQPVELMCGFEVLPLEPLSAKIKDLKSKAPFNNEVCGVSYDRNKKITRRKYIDIISGHRYKIIIYKRKGRWQIKQYFLFANRYIHI